VAGLQRLGFPLLLKEGNVLDWRAEARQAVSVGGMLNNVLGSIVFAGLAVGFGIVVRVVTGLPLAYLIPLAIVFFLLLGAASIAIVRWHIRRPRESPPQETFSSPGAPGELEVSIEREEWHPFRYKALILEARVRIHNRSAAHTRRLRRRAEAQIYEPDREPPSFAFMEDIEVQREEYRLQESRNPWPHSVDPKQTVHGWYVLALPHRPQGGEPSYEIIVLDELGHEYGVRRLARPK
jgi:hypothetical protein